MSYTLDDKLVVAVASSALFDLGEADLVYREQGLEAYRQYQRDNESVTLGHGVAFPLIRRLLAINPPIQNEPWVEVILLSRNDPDTGLRVLNSIEHYGLPIGRAVFVNGGNPFRYMNAFSAALFLSGHPTDVERAVKRDLPAGRVFPSDFIDNEAEEELRIAFDFDGVVVDDSAEAVFKTGDLKVFQQSETDSAKTPLPAGPLNKFFREIARLQERERQRAEVDASYRPRIRTAIVSARSAPAHERVITTLREWGIQVDEAFFLGGIEKSRVLEVFRPHIFFDDQLVHIEDAKRIAPSVHVPFGVANQPSEKDVEEAQLENESRKGKKRATED
jgi:5'-nucleotidase